VLPAEGAPLVFATQLTHDLVLHIEAGSNQKGLPRDVPLVVDASKGGLVPAQPLPALPEGNLTGVVRGKWGFDDWEGPRYQLVSAQPGQWRLAADDRTALVVGRDDTLHLEGQNSVCVDRVEAQTGKGHALHLAWKSPQPDALEVTVPLKDAAPGPMDIAVYQFGLAKPDRLEMEAYDAAASLVHLTLSSGDKTALLQGTRLDEVAKAEVNGITLTPSTLSRVENYDQLVMNAAGSTCGLEPGKPYVAHVELKDGRMLETPVTVDPPRPQVTLLNEGVQEDVGAPQPVQLGSPDDLPVESRLIFFLKSDVPPVFPRDEKVEVAAADSSFKTTLTLNDGLMLEDSHTAVGSLEPLARFGSSAFGSVRLRAISAGGAASDWLPLGTLVRLPGFKQLRCPRSILRPCMLSGTDLFLAVSFAATPSFDNPTDVPPQFTGTELTVPHPVNGVLYLKLRDDPATVQTLTLPEKPKSPAASEPSEVKPRPSPPPPAPAPLPAAPPATPATETNPPAHPTAAPATPLAQGPPAQDTQSPR
jgi:hypothetical protein